MDIIPSIQPGYYLNAQTISFTFSPDVDVAAYSLNGAPPSISKYIAYDTLSPPNPFIAVTQDGKGPVVYDGGFPKFYNGSAPGVGSPYDWLAPAHKYFVNAVNWVSKPGINPNRKQVLVLGDATGSENYKVLGSGNSDFMTTMSRIANAGGFDCVIKDSATYGGKLNPTLAEMETYNVVVIFSSCWNGGYDRITDQAVNDIVAYRENYGGLIIITDHGDVWDTIDKAMASRSGFFTMANRIATRFGAWFSGNYDRVPVNVGYIRSNWGDHPLYANMKDTDNIAAGGSESRVMVTNPTLYSPGNLPSVTVSTPGQNVVQILARGKDGSIQTVRYVYMIQSGDFLFFINRNSLLAISSDTEKLMLPTQFKLKVDTSNLGTVRGTILKNGLRVGGFEAINGVVTMQFINGTDQIECAMGDIFTAHVLQPFSYDKTLPVTRPTLSKPDAVKKTAFTNALRKNYGVTGIVASKLKKGMRSMISSQEAGRVKLSTTLHQMTALVNRTGSLPDLTVEVYETLTQANGYMSSKQPKPHDFVFIIQNNQTYGYDSGVWTKLSERPIDVLGKRMLTGQVNAWRPTAINCYFDKNGLLIKL